MKIVHVIPIVKGVRGDLLSYFTTKAVSEGMLVLVPARTRNVPAIVTEVREIEESKMDLKQANFKLRAVSSILSESVVSPEFLEAMREVASFYASPLGPVVKDFIPESILSSRKSPSGKPFPRRAPMEERRPRHEITLLQAPVVERIQYYRSIIREAFARGQSIFILFPILGVLNEFGAELRRGIEPYVFTLHAQMPDRTVRAEWLRAASELHPVLILGTRSFLGLPRRYHTLVVEGESAASYKLPSRPYVDVRRAAETIARRLGVRLILGDTVVRTESYHREASGEISPALVSPARLLSEAEQLVVDMKSPEKNLSPKTSPVLSAALESMIREAREHNERTILFVNRRGLSTVIVCHDCYRAILCTRCSAPLVTHKQGLGGGENRARGQILVCHKCLAEQAIPESCPSCGSWNMLSYGIGIEKVEEALRHLFPTATLFQLSSDVSPTQRQGEKIVQTFLETPGGILLSTEMLFSFLLKPVERVGVVSIDTLFAFPDFNMNEKIFHLLIRLRLLATKTFLIQTRLRMSGVFDLVARGNLSGFYKNEIEERRTLGFPPFTELVKVTYSGSDKAKVKREVDALATTLAPWQPVAYTAFIVKIKNLYSAHLLLKLLPGRWPHREAALSEKLRDLETPWRVDIGPETLL